MDNKKRAEFEKRIRKAIKSKLNFINPTMSPAKKCSKRNEIESLAKALEYYKEYVGSVVLQKKYMGSYCTIYLTRDINETQFFSRGGHEIKRDRDEMLNAVKEIHETVFRKVELGVNTVVIESELTPWSYMAKYLINNEYTTYCEAHQSRVSFLNENVELLGKISNLKDKYLTQDREALKPHEKRQFDALTKLTKLNQISQNDVDRYRKQIEVFGVEGPIEFKVFGVLKCIYESGSEIFNLVNLSPILDGLIPSEDVTVIDLFADDYLEKAYAFLEKHKVQNAEGIVVKPFMQEQMGIAPAFKVRTNDYLQLIYGMDFHVNYDEYFMRRNVSLKMSQSIADYEQGRMLIRINRNSINKQNKEYKHLLSLLIDGEDYGRTFDRRL